jgi:hypothetical protein
MVKPRRYAATTARNAYLAADPVKAAAARIAGRIAALRADRRQP